jgi:hypothetical protein
MINKTLKTVKVYWRDALIYSPETFRILELEPLLKVTEGVLVKDSKEGIFITDPYTILKKDGKRDLREIKAEKATFLFIPKGMIDRID